MEYANKVDNCIVGKEYLVAHAKIKFSNSGVTIHVPIIPLKHADPQFGFKKDHYHIDGRFDYKDAIVFGKFYIVGGLTNQIICLNEFGPEWEYPYKLLAIEYLVKKCLRKKTGIDPPKNSLVYNEWYDTYLGKSCAGKKCPHFGTQMITVKGKTFCPLHNLHADPIKEIIVPIY